MSKDEFDDLRKFVTGSGKQSRFIGQPTGAVRSGIKVSPQAEQQMLDALRPVILKALKSGKITSNIYGPEYATELTRKFVRAAIDGVRDE